MMDFEKGGRDVSRLEGLLTTSQMRDGEALVSMLLWIITGKINTMI